jgi:glycosyltransferase involved in cell wall biosynthesis
MAAGFGFLSTHPPTRCGVASFNAALVTHLASLGVHGGVVRVLTTVHDERGGGPEVAHVWDARAGGGWHDAAAALERFDVAIVQHGHGIYSGPDGCDVLPLLRRLTVPAIVVLHAVPTKPTGRQKELLEHIAGAAAAVVVMTRTARDRLVVGYRVDPSKTVVIPHGAAGHVGVLRGTGPRPHLLTWGLLGPGKGIEWALQALTYLQDLDPHPTYTIAGITHPAELEQRGESYRAGLQLLGAQLGVSDAVRYEQTYLDAESLGRLIRSADTVVLPYDSRELVSSGVLCEAVAAGIPVVATRFPLAMEMLTRGPGLLVPHRNPEALAAAIRRILTEPGLAAGLAVHRRQPVPTWTAVAVRYRALADRLIAGHAATATTDARV